MARGRMEAWVSVDTGISVVLHSTGFASWWDESEPQPSPGGPQMDFELDSPAQLDAVVDGLRVDGVVVLKTPRICHGVSVSRSCATPTGTVSG